MREVQVGEERDSEYLNQTNLLPSGNMALCDKDIVPGEVLPVVVIGKHMHHTPYPVIKVVVKNSSLCGLGAIADLYCHHYLINYL